MADNPSQSSGASGRYSVTGLSSEVTIMAGIVTAVSQGFVQVSNILEIRPFFVAISISVLLASYYIRLVHSATIARCFVLVPVVSAIIFDMSLSTNNLLVAAVRGTTTESNVAGEQIRIKNLEEQLNKLKQIIQLLRDLAGLPPEEASTKSSAVTRLMDLLGIVVTQAHGQEISVNLKRQPLLSRTRY